ncbi:MAG TPA: outer membrane beta-barrel protein [Bacteroidia bacterium]|nr:outer membrane beta-barrel protein [Bacteroidia bacterium]
MKNLKLILLLTVFFLKSYSQHSDGYGVNLPNFYKNKLHFGFMLVVNHTDFRIHTTNIAAFPDTVMDGIRYKIRTVYPKGDPGFALGIVCDTRLHEYLRLRFTPSISFASRSLEYTLENSKHDSSKIYVKSVESTFLIFPLEAKFQSKRLGNFSAYVIGGGGYTLDLASNKKAANVGSGTNRLDDAVRIKRDDLIWSAGAGTDFYLTYFKLGLEIKVLQGTKNLIYRDNNIFSKSVDKVNSRMVVFSITFEG